MKPGYYIDWAGDLMIIYKNKVVEVWSRYDNCFYEHREDNYEMMVESSIFLGDL